MCSVEGYNKNRLEAVIKEQGVSREEIARYLNISLTSLSYKINGIREFKGNEIFKLCKLLNIKDKDRVFFNENVD